MHSVETSRFSTLSEVLQFHASESSGAAHLMAFSYLSDGDTRDASLTYRELDTKARIVAARIRRHTSPGDRVLLVFPPSIDFIVAFFGCVYAGVIAVPALPPANAKTLPRLRLIAQDAGADIVLTLSSISARRRVNKIDDDPVLSALTWLEIDNVEEMFCDGEFLVAPSQASDIVFLQYTSGSTGTPKGVAVSNGNIIANVSLIAKSFPLAGEDAVVSWLPPHHDMGLIGKILFPLYVGCHCVHLPPAAFLARPYRWLKAISDFGARLTAAPNFAYELCINKITEEQRRTLDLSKLQYALNGAEPVRFKTLERFAKTFESCGFRSTAMTPVYGLAEATLLVTSNVASRHSSDDLLASGSLPKHLMISKAALMRDDVRLAAESSDIAYTVSSGTAAWGEHEVVIVDPNLLTPCEAGRVGEVWAAGPSIAQKYWNRPEESERTFFGHVEGRSTRFLRTGDLGFVHEGELYITGRMKDMLIFNGRNIYPQDIEATVEQADAAFSANGCAAFVLEEDEPRLVIVQEIQNRAQPAIDTLPARLRAEIAEQHGILNLAAIVLIRTGHLPRTSSGKVQRSRCRSLFLAGDFSAVWEWRDECEVAKADVRETIELMTETQQELATIWKNLLDVPTIGAQDNFFHLGGHSLVATQMLSQIRVRFGVELSSQEIFDAPTIASFSERIDAARQRGLETSVPAMAKVSRNQLLPLSFAQQRLWFLDQYESGSALYNMPSAIRLSGHLDIVALQRTLNDIVERHEALRTRFINQDGQARQDIVETLEVNISHVDLSNLPAGEREARASWLAQDEAQTPFDLGQR